MDKMERIEKTWKEAMERYRKVRGADSGATFEEIEDARIATKRAFKEWCVVRFPHRQSKEG